MASKKDFSKNKQLLRIEDLSVLQIKAIIEKAYLSLKRNKIRAQKKLESVPLALVFAEPSTRTRMSFEVAARSLGMQPYLIEESSSSLTKGEDLFDTLRNLQSMGIDNFVVRTSSTDQMLALREFSGSVLNAGDGVGEHPSQALLDLLALFDKLGSWKKLQASKIAIVGNLSHSRVVNSWISLGKLLNLNLALISPPEWAPKTKTKTWTDSLSDGLDDAAVVMALRVQKERFAGQSFDLSHYIKNYQIKDSHLKGRFLMHPGPVNWGVEVNGAIRGHANSLILDQVRCGCHLRATLLTEFIATP